jgi:hypothetical protein
LASLLVAGFDDDPGGSDADAAALIGAAVGLGSGAAFGALFPRERWKRVRLGATVAAGADTRLRLGIATAF